MKDKAANPPAEENSREVSDRYRNASGHKLLITVDGKTLTILAGEEVSFKQHLRPELAVYQNELQRIR